MAARRGLRSGEVVVAESQCARQFLASEGWEIDTVAVPPPSWSSIRRIA